MGRIGPIGLMSHIGPIVLSSNLQTHEILQEAQRKTGIEFSSHLACSAALRRNYSLIFLRAISHSIKFDEAEFIDRRLHFCVEIFLRLQPFFLSVWL